jgi:RNA polymerase sigma-70 factor (ECF subfamily)
MNASPTDIDLGHPCEFERAFELHRTVMLGAAASVLHDQAAAEDVVQDVFIQLWLSPSSYDPSRGSLRSYLMMLTRSRAIDRWRSRSAARGALERSAVETPVTSAQADDAAEVVIRRDGAREAVAAVAQLPPPQRDALLMAYGAGYSAREVAQATGTPLGTAKSRMRLGLSRAREALTAGLATS